MRELLEWYREHGRDLPWRRTRDPYRVLASEIMLQQTQVARVVPKYEAFVRAFPTLRSLASASRANVLRRWQGLGYNSRAARLHALAIFTERHGGELPRTREALTALPGIGPYTADAIMVFAHGEPAACADVNVRRVLGRLRGAFDEREALALCRESGDPHAWISALMDFGSAVCAARPRCDACPLRARCMTKGSRPGEKGKSQSAFRDSVRWWRGQILKRLLTEAASRHAILRSIRRHHTTDDIRKFDQALSGLERDGLVARNGQRLTVAGA